MFSPNTWLFTYIDTTSKVTEFNVFAVMSSLYEYTMLFNNIESTANFAGDMSGLMTIGNDC